MLQVDTTPLNLVAPLVNPSLPPAYQPNEGIITLPFTRNNLTFDLHTFPDGQYYSYQGQVLATHYRPVQPVDDQSLPADINGAVAHGFVLTQATFSEEADFDIRIVESWILGSGGSLPIEPTVTLSGWDHPFPVYLTQFTGLLTTQTNLNFVLGVYDADRGVERLYEELMGEVLYSDSSDWTPPTLISQADVRRAVGQAGFEAMQTEGNAEDAESAAREKEIARQRHLLGIGLIFTTPLCSLVLNYD